MIKLSTNTIAQARSFDALKCDFIPFRRNKSAFERVKAPGFNDRNWVNIDLILTQLRSLNPGSFHAAQMRIYFSEMVLFLGNGIRRKNRHFWFKMAIFLFSPNLSSAILFFFLARMILGHPMMQDSLNDRTDRDGLWIELHKKSEAEICEESLLLS
jgi:hypothetical protein